MNQSIPSVTTLRRCVAPLYDDLILKLQAKAKNKKIWVSLDETTDTEKRSIANFVFGILDDEKERNNCYLVNIAELQNCDATAIATFFTDSLHLLYPNGIHAAHFFDFFFIHLNMFFICIYSQGYEYNNILLVVTDAAPAMKSAMKKLSVIFPKMVHVTCIAHALHRLAEVVRGQFDNVNQLISSMKMVFLKSPARIRYFEENSYGIPHPPSPVLTRWGTWLEAAFYYADYFELIEHIIDGLNENDAESIVRAKAAIKDANLFADLIYIKANFSFLPVAITEAEARDRPINAVVSKVVEIRERLEALNQKVYVNKWKYVIDKNVGFHRIVKLNKILQGSAISSPDLRDLKSKYAAAEIAAFQYAPLSSADVERVFSQYKNIFRDNRHGFSFENLKKHVVLKCNCSLTENDSE